MAPTDTPARFPHAASLLRFFFAAVSLAVWSVCGSLRADNAPEPAPPKTPTPWQLAGIKAAMADPMPGVRASAIRICAEMGWGAALDPEQVAPFLQATDAMAVLGGPGPDSREDADLAWETRRGAVRALAHMGKRGAPYAGQVPPELRATYFHEAPEVLEAAIQTGDHGAALASEIIPLLDSWDSDERAAAIVVLQKIGRKDAAYLRTFSPLLRENGSTVRAAVTEALIEMSRDGFSVAAQLFSMLKDKDAPTRAATAAALGKLGEDGVGAAAQVALRLKDPDWNVRAAAAKALGELSKFGAGIDKLVVPLLTDPDGNARGSAAEALGKMDATGAAYAPQIAKLLADSDSDVRCSAIHALAQLGEADAAFEGQLAALLTGPDHPARCCAAAALLQLNKGAAHKEQIVAILDNADWTTRARTAMEFAEFRASSFSAAPLLAPLLRDPSLEARTAAAQAFVTMGGDAAAFSAEILPLLIDDEEQVRSLAADSLRTMADKQPGVVARAVPLLAGVNSFNTQPALRFIDQFADQLAAEKDRDTWFAAALEALQATPAHERPDLRAHLRIWCGLDERLQRALDWLGAPIATPKATDLSAVQLYELVVLITRLWQNAPVWSHETDELQDRVEQLAAVIPSAHDAKLENTFRELRNQCQARAGALREALRLADKLDETSAAVATQNSQDGAPPIAAWQLAGIQAALADASPAVRKEAVRICSANEWGRWLKPSQILPFLKVGGAQIAAAQLLSQMGPRGEAFVPQMLPLLKEQIAGGYKLQFDVGWAIGFMGKTCPSVAPRIAPFLTDYDSETRLAAVCAFSVIGQSAGSYAEQIAPLLKDPSYEVRCHAARALGQMGKEAEPFATQLLPLIDDPMDPVRPFAVSALGDLSGEAPAEFARHLVQHLKSPNLTMPEYATAALGKMGLKDPTIAAQVAPLLKDEEGYFRHLAADTLSGMGRNAAAFASDIFPLLKDKEGPSCASALAKLGLADDAVARQIVAHLKDSDALVRGRAAEALGLMEAKAAPIQDNAAPFLEPLATLLKDEVPDVRRSAVQAFGQIGAPAARFATQIAPLLQDDDVLVRGDAAYALGRMGKIAARFASQIAPLLHDDADYVRGNAALALGRLGENGATYSEQIAPELKTGSPMTRGYAATALARMGKQGAAFAGNVVPLLGQFEDYLRRDSDDSPADVVDQVGALGLYTDSAPTDRDIVHLSAAEALLKMRKEGADVAALALPLLLDTDRLTWTPLTRFLDRLGNQWPDEKAREAWLACALEALQTQTPSNRLAFRAHLRLWCGGDERLQRALDWIGDPRTLPKAADLAPAQIRELLTTFSALWEAAPRHPAALKPVERRADSTDPTPTANTPLPKPLRDLMLDDLAGGIEQIAAAIPSAPEAALTTILRKLGAQCESRETTLKAINCAAERTAATPQ